MTAKPIRRSNHLQAFSREHHAGLLFCWKLRQGIRLGVETERMSRFVDYFWKIHFQSHFEMEETLLFSNDSDALIKNAMDEHVLIKNQFKQIIGSAEKTKIDQFETIANDVDKHIRFEERVLFPHLEITMKKEDLERIGLAMHSENNKFPGEGFPDEFWKEKRSSL